METTYVYTLTTIPFLDTISKQYINIILIDEKPIGALAPFTKLTKINPPSHFKTGCSQSCSYTIHIPNNNNNICSNNNYTTINNIGTLYAFLIKNKYNIDTKLTNMTINNNVGIDSGKIIAFISITT